jgi:hypothetical protein
VPALIDGGGQRPPRASTFGFLRLAARGLAPTNAKGEMKARRQPLELARGSLYTWS